MLFSRGKYNSEDPQKLLTVKLLLRMLSRLCKGYAQNKIEHERVLSTLVFSPSAGTGANFATII